VVIGILKAGVCVVVACAGSTFMAASLGPLGGATIDRLSLHAKLISLRITMHAFEGELEPA
jgi:hypothetical protein